MVGVGRRVWGRAKEWPPTGGGEGGEYSLIAMLTFRQTRLDGAGMMVNLNHFHVAQIFD